MQWPIYYSWSLFIIRSPLLHHLCRFWLAVNIQRNLPGTKHGPTSVLWLQPLQKEASCHGTSGLIQDPFVFYLESVKTFVSYPIHSSTNIQKSCCESVENRKPSYEASIRKSANFQVCGSSSPSFYKVIVHCSNAVHFCVRFSTGKDKSLVILPLILEA